MKKTLLLLLIAMLGCMLMLAACNEQASVPTPDETPSGTETPDDPDTPDKQPHVHAFGEWITLSEPTCSDEGVEERICACGEQEMQETAALGHTEVVDAAVTGTCTTPSITEGKHCLVCGEVTVAQRTDAAPGHTVVVDAAEAATCSTEGKTEGRHCSVCGEVLVEQNTIGKLAHTEVIDAAVTATCTEDGKTEGKHCAVCGEVTVVPRVIPAKGHSPYIYEFGHEPTCGYPGTTRGEKCNYCGEVLLESKEIPKLEVHTEVVSAEGRPATCTSIGFTDQIECSVCYKVLVESTLIEKVPHTICSESENVVGLCCLMCSKKITAEDSVSKVNHNYRNFECTPTTHAMACMECGAAASIEAHLYAEDGITCTVCPYFKETPPEFTGGYVTTEITYIETEYVIYEIGPGVYVVNDLVEKTDALCRTLETVTGLYFKNASYGGKKILITSYADDPAFTAKLGGYSGKAGYGTYVNSRGDQGMHMVLLQTDTLFVGQNGAIAHELAHVLRFCQTYYQFNNMIEEGFAQIVSVRVIQYLEEHDMALAQSLGHWCQASFADDHPDLIENLPDYSMLEWFSLSESGHFITYTYGEALMLYLDETYGDYTSWISFTPVIFWLEDEVDLDCFKKAYGDSVFEDFYAWCVEFPEKIQYYYSARESYDLSELHSTTIYPAYSSTEHNCTTFCSDLSFSYCDLYINMENTVRYLQTFAGENVDDFTIVLSDSALVYAFDAEGNLVQVTYGQRVPLQGVSYVKLVGEGELAYFRIEGFHREYH